MESLAETLAHWQQEAVFGTLEREHYRLRFFSWGQGPPLLLVPGLATEARGFSLLMARLTASFRCLSYDLPDQHRNARLTHEALTADLCALLDRLHLPQSYLLGFSFGSTLALRALRTWPERFPRAVLVGGFAHRPLAPAEVLLARLLRHWRAPLRHLPCRETLLLRSHFPAFADKLPELWTFFQECCNGIPIAAVAERVLLLHHLDLRAELPAIRQPVLIVQGDDDPLVPTDCRVALRQGLPNAIEVELRGCGHYALFTHARELAELVRGFLRLPECPQTSSCPLSP